MVDRTSEVLQQYDVEVQRMAKGRGALILTTGEGLFLLREFKGSEKHVDAVAQIQEKIQEKGNILTDVYIKNKEGKYVSHSSDGVPYVLKKWYDCTECDQKALKDVLLGVSSLASLHSELEKIEGDFGIAEKNVLFDMKKHSREILKIKKYIQMKNKRNDFEILAGKWCMEFYNEGEHAIDLLSQYESEISAKKIICHGDYNYHNICFCQSRPVILNFDKVCINYPMWDFYNFMRKIMEKNDWNVKLGYFLINEYDKNRTLSSDDLRQLYIFFSFPEKFWKIINGYFNSRKTWMPVKTMEKLERVIAQNCKRQEFISTVN